MNYHNLREMCDRYGLQVSHNIAGKWEEGEAGLEYLLSVREDFGPGCWPIRVLGRIGRGELELMEQDQLEELVVGCSLASFSL